MQSLNEIQHLIFLFIPTATIGWLKKKTIFVRKKLAEHICLEVGLKGSKKDFWFQQSLGGPRAISVLIFFAFSRQWEGWVKICGDVKMVKTEMARRPPKLWRDQNSFWILSNQPQSWCVPGSAPFCCKWTSSFFKHPRLNCTSSPEL